MSELAANLRKARVFRSANRLERFQSAWTKAATAVLGADVAKHTRAESHAKGELKVIVASQGMVREIATFHSATLVAEVNRHLEGKDRIASIKAKFGVIPLPPG